MPSSTILYAEDDENDAFFMQRALTRMGRRGDLRVVQNGELATCYLSGTGNFARREEFPLPGWLLLDVKMPAMSGLEVLAWVRQRAEFNGLPVVMLTSSTQQTDVEFAAAHGANAYLVKPSRADSLPELLTALLAAPRPEIMAGSRLDIPGNQLPKIGAG